jgi:hypothetical protein
MPESYDLCAPGFPHIYIHTHTQTSITSLASHMILYKFQSFHPVSLHRTCGTYPHSFNPTHFYANKKCQSSLTMYLGTRSSNF